MSRSTKPFTTKQLRRAAELYRGRALRRQIPLQLVRCAVKAQENGGRAVIEPVNGHHGQIRVLIKEGYVVLAEDGPRNGASSLTAPVVKFKSPFKPGHLN